MDPATYARLYGPCTLPRPRPGHPVTLALAAVTWGLTAVSVAWLLLLFGIAAVWGMAAGQEVGGLVATVLLSLAGGGAVLAGLAFAPGVRRLDLAPRLLLLGVLAFPVPTALAAMSWANVA